MIGKGIFVCGRCFGFLNILWGCAVARIGDGCYDLLGGCRSVHTHGVGQQADRAGCDPGDCVDSFFHAGSTCGTAHAGYLILFHCNPLCFAVLYSYYIPCRRICQGSIPMKFIGIENFVRAFTRDNAWWTSVLNTFKFAALKLVIEIPLAFFLAAILNSKIRGRDLFRGIYFMPTVTSTAIISMVFTYLFSSYNGIINIGLKKMGLIQQLP